MTTLFGLDTLSHDARIQNLRAWLLERAIVLMAGDWRWALLGLACRTVGSWLRQARRKLIAVRGC